MKYKHTLILFTLIVWLHFLILIFWKKSLSEIFAMAKVNKAVWKKFQEVNSLFEMGRLKEQKVSSGEIVHSTVSLKQWHMNSHYVA